MRYIIDDLELEVLGDPHLGRRFLNGVPLHRRGDRERMVWADFEASLGRAVGKDAHINVGDLFDKAVVPFRVILSAAEMYRKAAAAAPDCMFFILMGNHDGSRDADHRTAFDVFSLLVRDVPNIVIVRDRVVRWRSLAFAPWHPFRTSAEMMETLEGDGHDLEAVFGHWDVDSFGGTPHNLVPYDWFGRRKAVCYTGHVHKPEVRRVQGIEVNIIGSMQPYAHGEDTDPPTRYITLTLAEVEANPEAYRDWCVRVQLRPGEALPELDCLQLTPQRISEEGKIEDLSVEFESFDLDALFLDSFQDNNVPPEISQQVRSRYLESRLQEVD